MKAGVLAEPVLVGRERELEELMRCFDSAVEGKGTTVFVSGEAGAGKTRFVNEFLSSVKHKREITTLTGWCLSNAAVPYFPFFEAFNAYFSGEHEPERIGAEEFEVTAWLMGSAQAEKLGKPQAVSSQVWKDQTFAAVAKTLTAISARKPVVLFIDDVHWADSASLALIHYIARATNSKRILLVATFRSEELKADAEGRPHPLVETLRLMRREELFKEIKIANLDQTSVFELAKSMLDGDLQQELAAKLVEESQGNALFVVESLRMLHERHGLVREHEKWRLASGELRIPDKIKDIILQRLSVLLHNQRRMLDAASVIGEKFGVELLASVLSQDYLEVADALDVIGKATSLVCCEGELYRFDHARSRDAIYDEVSPALKKGYHAKVAEKLEGMSKGGRPPLSEIAHHYAQAGNKEKAVKYALAAGQDALAKYSSSQAISHFTYVLQTLAEDPQYAEQRGGALEGLGEAFYASNKFKEAAKTFERLANTDIGTVKMRALIKAMFAAFFQGDLPHIAELVRRAEEYGDLRRLDRARILLFKMVELAFRGDSVKLAEESLRIFEEEYALSDAAWLLFLAAGNNKLEKRLAMALRSIAIYEDLGYFRSQMEAYNQTGGGHFSYYAFYPEALGLLEKVFEIEHKTKMGNYIMLAASCHYSAQIVGLMGDFSEAVSKGLRALEYLDKAGSTLYLVAIYSNLVVNYVRLGDMSHADEYFDKMVNLQTASNDPFATFYPVLAKAVYYAGKNQWEKSTKHFNETAANPMSHGTYSTLKFSFQENYAWALEKQGKSAEAKKLRGDINKVVEGYAERVKRAHVELGLMAPINVIAGQTFEARLDIVNVSRANCMITEIEQLVPSELDVVAISSKCITDEGVIKLKDKNLGPFKVTTITISLRAPKAGTFTLNPQVTYVDDLGQTKKNSTKAITITAKPEKPKYKVLPGRIPTGSTELDRLLLGGIPEKYAVVLTGSPSDEREKIVRNFMEAGIKEDEVIFYITTELVGLDGLLENPNFYLFLCNLKPKVEVPDLPNVFKLHGKTDLTNLNIALLKAYRSVKQSSSKRVCIGIVSDVLVDYGVKTTRKWIAELATDFVSKGFTVLAVMNPSMHPPDQASGVIDLFDGEISLYQSDDPLECRKSLRIKKLRGQHYIKNPICLTT